MKHDTRVTLPEALAQLILSLDGQQECALVAALVAADPRRADALAVTIGMALDASLMAQGSRSAVEGVGAHEGA